MYARLVQRLERMVPGEHLLEALADFDRALTAAPATPIVVDKDYAELLDALGVGRR